MYAVSDEELVFEAHEELRLTWIALTARASAQLQVHASALVPARADDVQAAERRNLVAVGRPLASKADIGAAAGHVGRDRHRAERAGPRDDRGLFGIVFRVQHFTRETRASQLPGEPLRLRHGGRSNQHGTSRGVRPANLLHDRA